MADGLGKSLRCIATIAATDFRFRFRRTTALVTLLVIAALVYLIVPDLRTGNALMQIGGSRVLYNSAAVALATAAMCGILLSLFGYYMVSNAFRRDILARTGYIIAATPVRNIEYIIGKFFGSAVYLSTLMLACMGSSMVMFLLRGETPLAPLVFLATYCWLVLPGIFFSAALALIFESVTLLSGRFGDILYFFLWSALVSVPAIFMASQITNNTAPVIPYWVNAIDVAGFEVMMQQIWAKFHVVSFQIGQAPFDPTRAPVLFPGFDWGPGIVASRCLTLILPAGLLLAAGAVFHRFNPARIKAMSRQSRRNPVTYINNRLKPLTRRFQSFGLPEAGKPSLVSAVRADLYATLTASPLTLIALIVLAPISLFLEPADLRGTLLPIITAILILAPADIATRDHSAGMAALLYTAPRIKKDYVFWKFCSALLLTLGFTLIPIFRLMVNYPGSGVSLVIGSLLMAAGAAGFGVLSRTPKAHVAVFLMLLYISLNARDAAGFDFAGFNGRATAVVQVGYFLLACIILFSAYIRHASTLRRE